MLAGGLMFSCTKTQTDNYVPDVTDNEFVPIDLPEETRSFVRGGNAFAIKLLQQVEEQKAGESFLISPLSIHMLKAASPASMKVYVVVFFVIFRYGFLRLQRQPEKFLHAVL